MNLSFKKTAAVEKYYKECTQSTRHECLGELCIVVVIFAADHVSLFLNVSVIKFFSNLLIVCSVQ